jgi:hypothetical protein
MKAIDLEVVTYCMVVLFVASIIATTSSQIVSAQISGPHFIANLSGQSAFPPIVTNATGAAQFTVLEDGNTMSYIVDANNISKVSNVVVSAWTGGRPTDLIDLRLRPLEGVSAPVSGILVAGNFTPSDFRNTLKGDQMSDLIKLILDGNAYVRIQTNNAPLGEIVGKITPNVVR